jgi:hypothetical protein
MLKYFVHPFPARAVNETAMNENAPQVSTDMSKVWEEHFTDRD